MNTYQLFAKIGVLSTGAVINHSTFVIFSGLKFLYQDWRFMLLPHLISLIRGRVHWTPYFFEVRKTRSRTTSLPAPCNYQ
jgi:hypothetical protein